MHDEENIDKIIVENQITSEILIEELGLKKRSLSEIQELEIIFNPKIISLKHFYIFPRLNELSIISPSLDFHKFDILGLDRLQNLTILRLLNCDIRDIDKGFTKLRNLKTLSLAENKIKLIRNLHYCIDLKQLFLYSNQISKIEYLQDCMNLEELDLSDNLVEKVENLDSLPCLSNLNLSANKIENLNNINNIKYICSLKILRFDDENFGPNPICELNDVYFEYVMKIKPDLECLDSFNVNFENLKLKNGNDNRHLSDNIPEHSIPYEKLSNKLAKYKKLIDEWETEKFEIFQETDSYLDKLSKRIYQTKEKLESDYNSFILRLDDNLKEPIEIKKDLNLITEGISISKSILKIKKSEYLKKLETTESFINMYKNLILNLNEIKTLCNLEKYSVDLKIMNFHNIHDFYSKFFPPYYSNEIFAFPFIIIKFIHKFTENNLEFENESYNEFSNYRYEVVETENLISIIKKILIGDLISVNNNNFKFYDICQQAHQLNKKNHYAILLRKSSIEKYICCLFNIDDLEFQEEDYNKLNIFETCIRNSEDKVFYNEETVDFLTKNFLDDEKKNLLISLKENSIEEMKLKNSELISSIFSLIN